MKAAKKISYSKDVDILMIQLSDKKVDDSYDADNMIVHLDKNREPVLLEIFNGKKYLKQLGKVVPKSIQKLVWPQTNSSSVAHRIK